MIEEEVQEIHKFHIRVTTKSLQDFTYPLNRIFLVAEFPTWTDMNKENQQKMNFRYPEVTVPKENEQIIYAYNSDPALYFLTPLQFRELLATKPFICEVCTFNF